MISKELVEPDRLLVPATALQKNRDGTAPIGLPEWAFRASKQIRAIVESDDFPCLFARKAVELRSPFYCFVESVTSTEGREWVRRALLHYLNVVCDPAASKTPLIPLLVVERPSDSPRAVETYRDQAWGLFQYLHDQDAAAWPADVPTNPERGDWSFCFAGRQLFSNVSCPSHQLRRSRNLGDSLVFAMQPRTNFDLVAGNSPRGLRVREQIRSRVEAYEGLPHSKDLGFFGSPENREWRQYAVQEEAASYPSSCPLKIRQSD